MKILFTADLHGLESAYIRFAELLKNYDIGVIAGDLQHDQLPEKEIAELLGVKVEEIRLNQEYDRFIDAYEFLLKQNDKAIKVQEIRLKNILKSVNKTILIITGNHDSCKWLSEDNIYNINQSSFKFENYNFVGYQYTHFERNEIMRESDLYSLESLMDENTILVTHSPPYRVLDTITIQIFGYGPTKEPLGCKAIKHFVDRMHPRLHLFGHIHECFGRRSNSINGSYWVPKKFWDIDIGTDYIRTKEI